MRKFLVCYEMEIYNARPHYAEVEACTKDEAILIVFARPSVTRIIGCEYTDRL